MTSGFHSGLKIARTPQTSVHTQNRKQDMVLLTAPTLFLLLVCVGCGSQGFIQKKMFGGGGGGGGGGGLVGSAVQNVLRLINSPEEVWPTAVSES